MTHGNSSPCVASTDPTRTSNESCSMVTSLVPGRDNLTLIMLTCRKYGLITAISVALYPMSMSLSTRSKTTSASLELSYPCPCESSVPCATSSHAMGQRMSSSVVASFFIVQSNMRPSYVRCSVTASGVLSGRSPLIGPPSR